MNRELTFKIKILNDQFPRISEVRLYYFSVNNCKTAEQIFLKQPLSAKKAAAVSSQECEAKIFLQKNFLALDLLNQRQLKRLTRVALEILFG